MPFIFLGGGEELFVLFIFLDSSFSLFLLNSSFVFKKVVDHKLPKY